MTTPRSRQATSAVSFRMPVEIRRRIRIAAGMDDALVPDWCIEALDEAARARISRGVDAAPAPPRRVSCDDVIAATAEFYDVPRSDLVSDSRRADYVERRQVAIFVCSELTGASASEIGRWFYRKHPAVGNSVRVIGEAMKHEPKIRDDVDALIRLVDRKTHEGRSDGRSEATDTGGSDPDHPEGNGPA